MVKSRLRPSSIVSRKSYKLRSGKRVKRGSQKVGLRSHVCPAGKHFSRSYDTKSKTHVKGSCKKHKGKKSGKKSAKKQSRK